MITTQTFTIGSLGNKTVGLLPFTPKALRFKVLKPGYADSTITFVSGGYCDGITQEGFSLLYDGTNSFRFVDGTKCLLGYDFSSGVATKVIEASFVSFGTNKFTLNFTAASAVYQIQVDILG